MPTKVRPILETVGAGARVAFPFIKALVGKGLGASEINSKVQSQFKSASAQDVFAIVRAETNALLTTLDIRKYAHDIAVSPDRIPEASTKIIAPYSYVVELRYFDETTGEVVTRNITTHSEVVKSFAEVEDLASQSTGEYYGQAGQEFIDAQVVDVRRAGESGII